MEDYELDEYGSEFCATWIETIKIYEDEETICQAEDDIQ